MYSILVLKKGIFGYQNRIHPQEYNDIVTIETIDHIGQGLGVLLRKEWKVIKWNISLCSVLYFSFAAHDCTHAEDVGIVCKTSPNPKGLFSILTSYEALKFLKFLTCKHVSSYCPSFYF